ncbi:hypothetical protein [Dactylosporangium sp. CA-233914]|uniref:hypothetical protein n=1 Tax=Dactylosporangium sp. CA-233914 TaxID=3239934 RepID=UPI003D9213A3
MAIKPEPDLVESLTGKFSRSADTVHAYASGWMSTLVVRAAREHGERCDGCPTCRDLSELQSGVAAIQILNPPPVEVLDPNRVRTAPAPPTGDDTLQRELLVVAAGRLCTA